MRRDEQHKSSGSRGLALVAVLVSVALGACSGAAATPSPVAASAAATTAPVATATTTAPVATATTTAPSVAPTPAVAPPAIQTAGKIVFCSDISSPPIEFMDANNQPTGSDIALGSAIAAQLGLEAVWSNIPFSGLIPALQAGNCDAVLSQLFDKPARREVINLVDYMNSSQSILVASGNPKHVQSLDDLSGLKVAVEDGTTIQTILATQNDTFKKANKPLIDIVVFPKDTDALQQLQIGQVDAYGTTLETAAYYITKSPNTFEVAGKPFGQILTGIGVVKTNTALTQAIQTAFSAVKASGTYLQILTQFGIQGDALP
jgi:polar amino acid transport system substrate-binding protein